MYAQIAVPLPIDRTFTYSVPEEICGEIVIGMRVAVPFSGRQLNGYVVGLTEKKPPYPVKKIGNVLDPFPIFNEEMLQLNRWIADYYGCSWGEALKAASPPVVKKVRKEKGAVETDPGAKSSFLIPTSEQQEALQLIEKCLHNRSGVVLLHGVTGSGKTEVYLHAIARVLERGQQAIVLLPEISLTPQTVERFRSRFGERIALWHSRLSAGERYREWVRIREGKADIVIGARSAIFAPVKDLGLIVLDEEHETSYKQAETPKYHAREVALERARAAGAVVILGTATPSLESYFQAGRGNYKLAQLTRRVDDRVMPEVEIIDMRKELITRGNRSVFSFFLQQAIRETLERREQVILFLNRRGFSTFVLCRECGEVVRCKHCDVSLIYHSKTDRIHCHYCNCQQEKPQFCPECRSRKIGYLGVGTQKVENEVAKLFPQAILGRMDSDTMTRKGSHARMLNSFRKQEVDILIGTQMIAKGLDFPRVTLVGVVSADTALSLADFRAGERTFQLLTQVAGRTGRGDLGGKVIVQTYNPEHYSIQSARLHDYAGFYRQEIKFRQELGYPPFKHLINITLQSPNQDRLIKLAQSLGKLLEAGAEKGVEVLGPVPAPLPRLKSRWRWRIILKGNKVCQMREVVKESLTQLKGPASRGVKILLDIDPMGML
ncbi:MAG: primosomal protein N' [Nitrospirae bacterium]|nr:primosomal protein N' [Nitrospirota bacterium]